MKDTWIPLTPPEKSRTYLYPLPNGTTRRLTFSNVTTLYADSNGTHYLECAEGKVVVQPGWYAITLLADAWTYPKR